MPTRRLKPTNARAQENRTRLLRLKEMGIPVKQVCDSSHERNRITVELAPHEYARIFEFTMGEVAVVVPAWITVHISGTVIADCEMGMLCDDVRLEVSDPDEIPY